MKTIKSNCTDAELSAAVAEHVAGWQCVHQQSYCDGEGGFDYGYCGMPPKQNLRRPIPEFATSADAVLPLLEKWVAEDRDYRVANLSIHFESNLVELRGWDDGPNVYHADTLPRCVCFALLKAKGWTVEEAP